MNNTERYKEVINKISKIDNDIAELELDVDDIKLKGDKWIYTNRKIKYLNRKLEILLRAITYGKSKNHKNKCYLYDAELDDLHSRALDVLAEIEFMFVSIRRDRILDKN